jgi:PIN like domain
VSEPIRILFDENFGEPLVSALARFLDWDETPKEIRHLFAFAKQSETDDVWVPKIATGGWTVITTDRAKRSSERKLPRICFENNVTHILISAGIHGAKQFEKGRAILAVWPEVIAAANGPRGRRFSLRYIGALKRVVLVECQIPQGPPVKKAVMPFSSKRKRAVHGQSKRRGPKDVQGQTRFHWNQG